MRKQLGASPSGSTDTATKGYVDTAVASVTRTSLGVNLVDNTSDATKNAAAVTLTNHSIDTGANTLTGLGWAPEAVISSATLVTGYNDLPGGISVEPGLNANGVYLDSVWIRLGTLGATVATSSCVFDVYGGNATAQGTLIVSITIGVGANNQIATLGSPYALAANSVVRINCSSAGGVSTPVHCQLRGRYHG